MVEPESEPSEADLLPVRMLNEYVYCPRLFHLMHVEKQWADNAYTVEGRHVHRRVDELDHILPQANPSAAQTPDQSCSSGLKISGDDPPIVVRSVPLASESLGIIAKLDLVSIDDAPVDGMIPIAVPVETKRGRVPDTPERSYEPERVQLMAQGLLLREQGYLCDHGILYFAESRTRVTVPFTAELEQHTHDMIRQARDAADRCDLPAPLQDSPKCKGCSLSGICLPDETLVLQHRSAVPEHPSESPDCTIRRLYPVRDDASPLYVQEQGAFVGKSGQRLVVRKEGQELSSLRLIDVSQLVLCGNIGISAQTIHLLCEMGIPVVHLSMGHWFYGITHGITLRNAFDRAAQFRAAADPAVCLTFARQLVLDKAANQRTLLRRNAASSQAMDRVLQDMDGFEPRIGTAADLSTLLGLEGAVAALYFQRFADMLKPRDFDAQWDFRSRNRRPPRDPVNAMLSFAYALLTKECTVALLSEGLDPWWGFYHQPRHGRPALALDMMEPLRPLIADSVVITAINTGMVSIRGFTRGASACMLNDAGRKAMLRAFESRLDQLITHPLFDYRCSWRSAIRLQARLLARWLRHDIPVYQHIVTR